MIEQNWQKSSQPSIDLPGGWPHPGEHAGLQGPRPILPGDGVRAGAGNEHSPAGELGHQERDAPGQGRDQPDQLGRGFGDVAADEGRGVTVGERAEPELGCAVPVDEAPPRRLQPMSGRHRRGQPIRGQPIRGQPIRGQQSRRRNRAVREHDAHPLAARRPGEVVQQAQGAVVSVVYVVDGEQQALTRRGQPD
jgi:hypothetical protein